MTLDKLISDKKIAMSGVKRHGWILNYLDKSLKQNKEIVMTAVRQFGLALKYADEQLQKDPEIVLSAIKKNRVAFQYASKILKNDREFIMESVKTNGRVIDLVDDKWKNDKEIVLTAAIQKHKWPAGYMDYPIWEDRDFVLNEIRKNGAALECAADSLKKDREVVLNAVKQYRWALRYADESLRKDPEIVLAAKREHGWALDAVHPSLWRDKDFVLKIVKENGNAFRFADDSLKRDKDFVLKIVKENGWALRYAYEPLKKDDQIMQTAFERFGRKFSLDSILKTENNSIKAISYEELISDPAKRIITSWSGGKDCCLALYRILKDKKNKLSYLLNCTSNQSGNVSFHEIDAKLLKSQMNFLEVPYLMKSTTQDGYQDECKNAVESLVIPQGIDSMIFGNIYVDEHKEWGEHLCEDVGIESIESIWNEDTENLANEVLSSKIEAYIICANANIIDKYWVGKKFDKDFLNYAKKNKIDLCGEYGEFHTFVTSCPLFKGKITFADTEVCRKDDYWVLKVKKVKVDKG